MEDTNLNSRSLFLQSSLIIFSFDIFAIYISNISSIFSAWKWNLCGSLSSSKRTHTFLALAVWIAAKTQFCRCGDTYTLQLKPFSTGFLLKGQPGCLSLMLQWWRYLLYLAMIRLLPNQNGRFIIWFRIGLSGSSLVRSASGPVPGLCSWLLVDSLAALGSRLICCSGLALVLATAFDQLCDKCHYKAAC